MDLITYALAKKASGSGGSVKPIIPTIGENGNWFIDGIDTGFRAVAIIEDFEPENNIEITNFIPE